jgi:hypothetical protein
MVKTIDDQIQALKAKKEKRELDNFKKNVVPKLKKMLDQCFVYEKDSYSSPKSEDDYWSDYYRIVDYLYDGEYRFIFIVESFCVDDDGRCELRTSKEYVGMDGQCTLLRHCTPITTEEWGKQQDIFDNEVSFHTKMKHVFKRENDAR